MQRFLAGMLGRSLVTLAAGALGGIAFFLAGLPAPWLSGPMVTIAILIVAGYVPTLPDPMRDLGMMLAGVVMGSAITPAMIAALGRYPVSLAILALTTLAIIVLGRFALMKLFRWDGDTALLGSLPGAMSAVLATAASANVQMQQVITVQAFRMFILVALLPTIVSLVMPTTPPPAQVLVAPQGFAVVMAAALALSLLFSRIGVFAPFLMGGMVAAGATHATDMIVGAPPDFIGSLSMFLIGVFAGSRMSDITTHSLARLIGPAIVLFVMSISIALLGALGVTLFTSTPLAEALVAFAPGGLEAMVVLGMAMGLDPLYVSSHHIVRFLLIAAGLPLVARWVLNSEP